MTSSADVCEAAKEHNVDEFLKDRHVRFAWVDNNPMLLQPEGVELPGL